MISVAITGGIGSGKTEVTNYLISKGFTVIDADQMSREMTGAGGKAMPYILEHFAKKELLEEGTTKVVLADIEAIRKEREESGDKILFFDIPLLFETGTHVDYDAVLVVTADYEIRKARVMARDGIDPAIIDLIMDTQSDEERKIAMADFVIFNNGTIEELHDAVDMLIKKLEF